MVTGRIARFDAPEKPFTLTEATLDGVEPGQVLVKVRRTNICASDLHAWHGTFKTAGLGGQLPTVLGHEMVGEIAELGTGMTADSNGSPLDIGTRIVFPYFYSCHQCYWCLRGHRTSCEKLSMAMLGNADQPPYFVGGYADYYVLPAGAVIYTVPEGVPDELAAGANCALSQVMYGLERAEQRFGDAVVVQGAGGLGLYAIAVAKARGASTVIAIDGVADRLELAKELGADHVIDLTEVSEVRERAKLVRSWTSGRGADVVIEVVGIPAAIDEGLKFLAMYGRYVEIGNINFGRTFEFDPSSFVFSNKTMIGVSLYEPDVLSRALEFLEEWLHKIPLHKLAVATYGLEQLNEAFDNADNRRDVRSCIVM